MPQNYIIAGGGIAGILSSLLLRKYAPDSNITLIEPNASLGGLLRSFDYGDHGLFDYGTHYLNESGIADIDDIMETALPKSERHTMHGYKTDVSGVFRNGKLQNNSPCLDIRSHPQANDYIADFIANSHHERPSTILNARDHYNACYGAKITTDFVAPPIQKLFKKPLFEMSHMGTRFLPLGRIILSDNFELEGMHDNARHSLAHTDQRTVPPSTNPKPNAFYAKKRGIGLLINRLTDLMQDQDIQILYNQKVRQVKIQGERVTSVDVSSGKDSEGVTIPTDLFVSAAGIMPLTNFFDIKDFNLKDLDAPRTTILVHFNLSKPLQTQGLYYFYCYDEGFHSFRITDYRNYCPEAQSDGDNGKGYPVTIEMVFDNNTNYDDAAFCKIASDELVKMNVLDDNTNILFQKSERLDYGFPLLTVKNYDAFANVRHQIESMNLKNFISCGALSSANVYFQWDIIADVYKKISSYTQFERQAA